MLLWSGELSRSARYIRERIRAHPIQSMEVRTEEVDVATTRVEQRLELLVRCIMPCRDGKAKVEERDSHKRDTKTTT